MDLSERVLGHTIAVELRTRTASPILTIGRDHFTRGQLARVECFNFVAAQRLSKVLNDELSVKDTRHVFEHIAPDALALPTIGCVALAVLGAAFEAKRLGGDHPLDAWAARHSTRDDHAFVTFTSYKVRKSKDVEAAKAERAAARRRRRAQPSTPTAEG